MRYVRITEIPPGEAPQPVRAAWVGLVLPLAEDFPQPCTLKTHGVMTNLQGWFHRIKRMLKIPTREEIMEGYVVDVIPAVAILHSSHREAAAWWERNTPHLLKGREKFVFPASCCSETTAVPERDDTPGSEDLCAQCGHPFNPHRLSGYGDPPTEGWMECPVEGCGCRMTWSMDADVSAEIKACFKPAS